MDLQIKPYCYEEDQTHKRAFGYNQCAYCNVDLCMYCDGTIPAVGKYCSMKTGEAFPVCAYHKKAHTETKDVFYDRL